MMAPLVGREGEGSPRCLSSRRSRALSLSRELFDGEQRVASDVVAVVASVHVVVVVADVEHEIRPISAFWSLIQDIAVIVTFTDAPGT